LRASTEPGALHSLGPIPGSLDHDVDRWARCVTDILTSPSRVTSYVFQRTAATIARVCFAAAAVLEVPAGVRLTDNRFALLVTAAQAWQTAADWPPEVRLGGRTTPLRERSRELDEALANQPLDEAASKDWQDTIRGALLRAEKVAACHQAALCQVVGSRSLWISVEALGPNYLTHNPGASRSDWVPDPGTHGGEVLLHACTQAGRDLEAALNPLHHPPGASAAATHGQGPRWETVLAPNRSQRPRSPAASMPPGRGFAR